MNISSTSSFLEFNDCTSSGGNLYSRNGRDKVIFFSSGKILIPNAETEAAIFESDRLTTARYESSDALLNSLNE